VTGPDWEYHRVSLPIGTSREHARAVLSVAASYGGWELRRYRSWPDGRRKVDLRRRRDPSRDPNEAPLPLLSL
jgi:hypothetical protein